MTRTASQDAVDQRRAERREQRQARIDELHSRKGADLEALQAATARPVPEVPRRPRLARRGELTEAQKDRLRDVTAAQGGYEYARAMFELAQIEALNAGVPAAALARSLGISAQAVHQRAARWMEEDQ